MANNPRWLSLLEKIAESWDDGDRSLRDNRIDKEVHKTILDTLMLGKPLSAKQSAALIRSIQRRVPFQSQFSFHGEIVLTRKQVRYANTATIARIRQTFTTEPTGFATTTTGTDLSSICQPNVSASAPVSPAFVEHSPPLSPENTLEALPNKGSNDTTILNPHFAALNSGTPRDETRRNAPSGIEKGPTGDVGPANQHHTGTDTLTRVVHTETSSLGSGASKSTLVESNKKPKGKRRLGDVALWLNNGITGTMNVNGEAVQLDFKRYIDFENSHFNAHKNAGHLDWWMKRYHPAFAEDLFVFWNANPHEKPRWTQWAISGLLKERGRNHLIAEKAAVRLFYGDNNWPRSMMLLWDDELYSAPIRENNSQNSKAPDYKADTWIFEGSA